MTLLTPAVLHRSALEHIKDESPKFHRKYVFRFALMQGVWGLILYVLCFAVILLPQADVVRSVGEKMLTNANFSTISIKKNLMAVDIKPAIWSYTFDVTTHSKNEIVVDSTGTMNKYYWDDRVEKGQVTQINGMGVMRDQIFLKSGSLIRKIPYGSLTMGRDFQFTKGDMYNTLLKYTDKAYLLKIALVLAPLVFLISCLLGAVFHVAFIGVAGSMLVLLTQKSTRTIAQCYKTASGLYIGFAYVVVLSLAAQKILFLTLADFSSFFFAIRIVTFVTMVMIGYLSFRSLDEFKQKVVVAKMSSKKSQ